MHQLGVAKRCCDVCAMPDFTVQDVHIGDNDADTSRITDIALGTGAQAGNLYTTTRFDGQINSFDISGAGLDLQDAQGFQTGPMAGSQPHLAFVDTDTGLTLLTGGAAGGALGLVDLGATGSLGTVQSIGPTTAYDSPLIDPITVDLDGQTGVYAGFAAGAGVAWMVLDSGGALIDQGVATDFGSTHARDITGMAHAQIGTTDFIFTTSATDLGVTSWQIADDGSLRARNSLTPEDGLWINAPSALETVSIDGETYLVMAAAGSGSLSVMSVGPLGELAIVDHVIDDRDTRFDGATSPEVITHNGQVWVFAGGSDDGISAFVMLPDGSLVARAHIEDTDTITLANISALAAQSDGTGIAIFAASATDAGLTELRIETGAAGITTTGSGSITGTSGSDILMGDATDDTINAGAGDDIIADGAGADILTGGAGADMFLLGADSSFDEITDFTLGEDQIDLGAWPGLRSMNQLFLTPTADGIQISYGDEVLVVRSSDGQPILPSDLTDADLIGPAHVGPEIVTGFAGPVTAAPDLPDRPAPAPTSPQVTDLSETRDIFGTAGIDTLMGSTEDDFLFGQAGNDRVIAGEGADLLFGGLGNDMLDGSAGNDMLYGGEGRDADWMAPTTKVQSTNADRLIGGPGDDTLYGEAGHDTLDGGSGDDVMTGGGGRDTFVFRSGTDQIMDFTAVTDRIALDDALWDSTMTPDQVVDRFARDTGSDVVLDFGGGDVLILSGVDDLDGLAARIDIV